MLLRVLLPLEIPPRRQEELLAARTVVISQLSLLSFHFLAFTYKLQLLSFHFLARCLSSRHITIKRSLLDSGPVSCTIAYPRRMEASLMLVHIYRCVRGERQRWRSRECADGMDSARDIDYRSAVELCTRTLSNASATISPRLPMRHLSVHFPKHLENPPRQHNRHTRGKTRAQLTKSIVPMIATASASKWPLLI